MNPIKYGIDCATVLTNESANNLHNIGYEIAIRYLVPKTFNKHLSRKEAETITTNKMKIGTVFETTGTTAKGGYSAGVQDAETALKCAADLDIPAGACIYFAIDYQPVSTNDYYNISNYFIGVSSIIANYKIGVYGSYDVVEWLYRQKICHCYWQCVAWSDGKISEHSTMYQRKGNAYLCGVYVDLNDIYDDIGFWNYDTAQELVKTILAIVNGVEMPLKTVNINGENYIRIRDVADASNDDNVTVTWDEANGKLILITKAVEK